jgi:hypothetical protein
MTPLKLKRKTGTAVNRSQTKFLIVYNTSKPWRKIWIRIGIKMESRIVIGIICMSIHNTAFL